MNSFGTATIIFACALGAGLVGMWLHGRLPEHHRDAGSKDVVKLIMSLIATMAALVLSLLIASGSSSYQAQENEVQSLSANVMLLDRLLSFYGPDAQESRDMLRHGVGVVHDQIWSPDGERAADLDPRATQGMADTFMDNLESLSPKTDPQKLLKTQAMQVAQNLGQTRMLMFEQSGSSISWPFLTVLVFWICMLFLGFGLFARFNATVTVALFIGAISVAGAIFLILELNEPYGGFMRVSDAPLRAALVQDRRVVAEMAVDQRRAPPVRKARTARSVRVGWRRHTHRAVLAAILLMSCCVRPVRAEEPARFVGAAGCSGCHQTEAALWKTSHHAKAMQPATADTVLGAFDNANPSHNGTAAGFRRSGETYMVRDGRRRRGSPRLRDRLYVWCLSASAIPDRPLRWPVAGVRRRLGQPSGGAGRSAVVSPVSGPDPVGRRSPALDRPRPDLELHVRQLSLNEPAEEL